MATPMAAPTTGELAASTVENWARKPNPGIRESWEMINPMIRDAKSPWAIKPSPSMNHRWAHRLINPWFPFAILFDS